MKSKTAKFSTNMFDGVRSDFEVLKIQITIPLPTVEAQNRKI